jgi:CubicO group peptidase (beta-lactamase class C family)
MRTPLWIFQKMVEMNMTRIGTVLMILTTLTMIGCSTTGKVAPSAQTIPEQRISLGQGENSGHYWPTEGWRTCAPESVGMDSKKLAEAMEYAARPEFKTDGIIVIKDGYIVAESYLGDFKQESEHTSHSMAKSFTSALVGIAIDKGLLADIDERVCQYYDDWDCDDASDLRSKITLRHAMTLTTGLEWNEDWSTWDFNANDALKMSLSGHFYKYMSERSSLYPPGEHFLYSTGDPMLISRVLQETTGMTTYEFADQNLFKPLNISDVSWDKDLDGYTATAFGLYTTVRNYAKFGFLYMNKGLWDGRQIVSEQWVAKSTKTDPSVDMWDAYGYLWHVNLPLRFADKDPLAHVDGIPADGYMAAGVQGQNIIIIPSKKLLIVKVANQQKQKIDLAKLITLLLSAEIH